jgi:hypothetical protein
MLRGEFPSAGQSTHGELRAAYDDRLAAAITAVGEAEVADRTGLDRSTLRALRDGESPELSLEDATAVLATEPGSPDAGTLLAEARDILLMGMSAAVLDVEAIAAGIDDEMEPKEIQQKVEGRYPMTVDEYARLHAYIEGAKR